MDQDRTDHTPADPSSAAHHTLIEQYSVAVGLYRHEDELNWRKLNHLFYTNAGFLAVAEWTMRPEPKGYVIVVLGVIGMIVSSSFLISIWAGTRYLMDRKEKAGHIERLLEGYGGVQIIRRDVPADGTSLFRRSPTIAMLRFIPVFFLLIWLGILLAGVSILLVEVFA